MKTAIDLQQDLIDELAWERSIDAADIGVTVKDGIVTLSGRVGSFAEKQTAEHAALRVSGVRGVANELTVDVPRPHVRTDKDIAEAALHALSWDVRFPSDRVKVAVKNGWVTLSGTLDWNYQKSIAYEDVRNLAGVRGVINEIAVEPRYASPAEIKTQIVRAFERSAQFDADRISVQVIEDKVILRGSVSSLLERIEAGRAAWAAPGVMEVENHLTVTKPRRCIGHESRPRNDRPSPSACWEFPDASNVGS